MTCCSGRRATLNRGNGLRAAPAAPPRARDAARLPARVTLHYRGPVPMVLPSPSGASPYTLRAAGQALDVDAADAEALLRTGWFVPA